MYCVDYLDIHLCRITKKIRPEAPTYHLDIVSIHQCATCRHRHDCLEWSKHTYEPAPRNIEDLEKLWHQDP